MNENNPNDIFNKLAQAHREAVTEERKSHARGWLQLAAFVTIVICVIAILAR